MQIKLALCRKDFTRGSNYRKIVFFLILKITKTSKDFHKKWSFFKQVKILEDYNLSQTNYTMLLIVLYVYYKLTEKSI